MKDQMHKIWESIKTFASKIHYKSILRGARLTYGVTWNLLLLFIIVFIIGGAFAGGIGLGYFASLVKDQKVLAKEEMVKSVYQYEETSTVYFANNKTLGKLRSDIDREEIKIDQISDHLKKAVIATEDEYFYEHKGVVPKALFRAVFQEFTNSSVQSGGSTLTQQLIKNQILTNEVSFDRKAKEVLLALRIERFMEKDEILEAYLNVTTFGRNSSGQNIGGVQAAAKGIFGKDAKDLSLPQAAFIAGLPQSPFRYTPFTNQGEIKDAELLEPGLNRMKTVLKRMKKEEYITEKEYKEAIAYDITKDFISKQPRSYDKYPALIEEIEGRSIEILAEILAKQDGYEKKDLKEDEALSSKYLTLADRDIRQNGYQIHSTIDKKLYEALDKTKNDFQNFGPTYKRERKNPETGKLEEVDDPMQIGAILIDNKSGKILSFVGGRDFKLDQWNYATSVPRANGSSMKPLLVYGPAIEMGESAPGAVIADLPYNFPNGSGGTYTPRNYSSWRYYGLVSAREALANSYNASAVSTFWKIRDKDPGQYLRKMGITSVSKEEGSYLSSALGGLTHGVTVEENTNAYTTFANGGKFVDAYMIEKITDHDGNIVYEHKKKPVEVFSPQTAYLMIDMMRGVFNRPGATASSIPGMLKFSTDWAGKTGTTNEYRDSWLIGSNPNITFGTWIGYASNRTSNTDNGQRNYRIWANLINSAYDVDPDLIAPKERFKAPGGIVSRSYCAVSGMAPSEACQKAGLVRTDIYNAKYVPNKTDDSLGAGGRYILANGKKYAALSSTPKEFTREGLIINPGFLNRITYGYVNDFSQLVPANSQWERLVVADAKLEDDGKAPAAVSAKMNGQTITWNKSGSHDVVGYRVYNEAGKKVASVLSDGTLSHNVGNGKYYVVAVDIAGRESKPSNHVGKAAQEKKAKEEEVAKKSADDANKKKEDQQKIEEQKNAEEAKKIEQEKQQAEAQKEKEKEKKEEEKVEKEEKKEQPEPEQEKKEE
ncbi:transglycosylase domain-containing protein [Lederbergia galactosidilytica]|uniref:Peptidoglycan glycosyltransferase n=1 Tax=Lederbergia galactosidilytica TaxID=217031 RepID=A0A177ZL43_9BACI|nr:transglycosylase domain-containing protein [Lederbergia galactosidilytica]MBP1915349.1 penicillin-binding protein [Lederbergia galactosidilytica]OAK68169.1 peptidoglycan glycosyltransferase [Lederbergia galactosidilytica]